MDSSRLHLEVRHPSASSSALSRKRVETRSRDRWPETKGILSSFTQKPFAGSCALESSVSWFYDPILISMLIECHPAVSTVQGTRKVQAQYLRAPLGRSLVRRRREVPVTHALDPSSAWTSGSQARRRDQIPILGRGSKDSDLGNKGLCP